MSKQINQSIIIDAKVKATLEGMSQVVADLNKGLREGATKIDLTKGIGNSISKQIETFKTEYQKFANLTKGGKIEFIDTKEAVHSGEQMIKTFTELRRIVGNFEELSVLDAKRMFPDAFDSRVEALRKNFTALRNSIVELDAKKLSLDQATTELSNLQAQQEALKQSLATAMSVEIDTEGAERDLEKATEKVKNLREELEKTLNAKLGETEVLATELSTRKEAILKARTARGAKSAPETLTSARARGASAEELEAIRKAQTLYNQEEKELKEIEDALKKNADAAKNFRKAIVGTDKASLKKLAEDAKASSDKFKEINAALDEQATAQARVNEVTGQATEQKENIARIKEELDETTQSIEKQETKVSKLKTAYETLKSKVNPEALTKAFKEIGIDFTPEMARNEESVLALQKRLNELDEVSHKKLIKSLNDMGLSADSTEDFIKQLRGELGKVGNVAEGIAKNAQEIENLKNQVLQFFSITNSIQLFKRAITSAMSTVKELDATMTEAAVVTDFSIGDMWNKLPEYSAQAKRLGVSINSMYQATTLYYQQGLKNNAAMALGVETMKMAKIAGIDSANATKAMTSALRGFNMELNETSAQKVNDVYSQLAAVTAADTNQIATAMEKTASIAAAANMEFETTAAFLAQIIETTQEAPETAGTALKTIIARFAEVKSLREQGLSSGQDDEGEIIDVNKIQTALRTVGISMDGFFAGTEGLDDVLLKLSEKWSTLDFETQRYIATMAAGSRQQSRFIAMMSDYGRTTELVGEAQNSAGASQKQFEKTQESLATSLQKLENAWKQFLMGLTNNDVLKFAVDTLTTVLTVINKIIDGISGGNGLIKAVTSLVGVIGALKLGRSVFEGKGTGNILGKLIGQGQTEVIDRKTTDANGNIVEEHIVKNPQAQGIQAGEKAGQGFVAGFRKAVEKNKAGESGVKNFIGNIFTRKQDFQMKGSLKNFDKDALGKQLAKEEMDLGENDLSQRAMDLRKLNEELADGQITTEQAAERYQQMGGSLENLGPTIRATTLNLQGMGQASMGAGAALGGLSAIFSAMGIDEAAEATSTLAAVFMGLGTVMTTLSSIAPMLGMSFTTAGIQITKAGVTSQLAWWWVFAIIAAVALLAAGIVALFKSKDDGLEKQLESVNNQIDQMNTAADEAASSLDKLTESRDELADMQNVFKGLVKGTTEWRKALIDSNAKVLELLDTYPELSKYVTISKDGLMEIDSAGWNEMISMQQEAVVNAQAVSAGLRVRKSQLESEQLDQQYYSGEITATEWQGRKKNLELQREATANAFQTSVMATSSYLSNSEYAQAAMTAQGLDQTSEEIAQEIDAAKSEYLSKDNEDKLVREYAALVGKEESEIRKQLEDKEINKEDMAATVSAQKYVEKTAEAMEKTAKEISNIEDKDTKKLVQKMLTKDGEGLKKSDIKDFKNAIGKDNITMTDLETYFTNLGINLSPEALSGLAQNFKNVSDAYDINLNERLSKLGFGEESGVVQLIEKTDYGTSQGMVEKIATMQAEGASTEEIETLMQSVSGLVGTLGDEALAFLADTNWQSKEAVAEAIGYLTTLEGANVEALEELGDRIIDLSDAVSENTGAQLRNKGWGLQDILDQILSGEMSGNSITGEQKKALTSDQIGLNESDFIQTGLDTWQYKGDLYSKVVNLYTDNLENQKDKVEEAKTEYEKAQTYEAFAKDVQAAKTFTFETGAEAFMARTKDKHGTDWENYKSANKLSFSSKKDEADAYYAWASEVDTENASKNMKDLHNKQQDWEASNSELGGASLWKTYQDIYNQQSKDVDHVYHAMADAFKEPYEADLSPDEKLDKIKEWEEKYADKIEGYKAAYDQARLESAEMPQTNTNATTTQIGWEKFDSPGEQQEYNDKRSGALEQRVASTGGSVFIDDIKESVEGAGGNVDEFKDAINALASDMAVNTKKVKNFATNMANLSETLTKENRGTIEYGVALGQAKTNVASLYGIDLEKLDAAGISDELYEQLAQGSTQALTQIQQQLIQTLEMPVNLNLKPTMNQEEIVALYKQLTGVTDTTNISMDEIMKTVAQRLNLYGNTFSAQMDAATGQFSAIIGVTDYSKILSKYYPKKPAAAKFENTLDKQFNSYEKINTLLREREKLERSYDRLLKNREVSGKALLENTKKQLANLEAEAALQRTIEAGKEKEISDYQKKNRGTMNKYGIYVDENGTVQANWSKINTIKNSDTGEKVLEIIDTLKGLVGQRNEAQDELERIGDDTEAIRNEGLDDYLQFEQQIKNAYLDSLQKEVDALNEINDSINDANAKMLESMQQQIDEYRQNRDNEKTEQDIEDKQRRLAYLQQDTSGANALEIMQLEKEIEDAQESYTDQLIDQKISELQKQNDEAAEQRERQIQLMEARNKLDEETGKIWDAIFEYYNTGFDEDGKLDWSTPIGELLKKAAGFDSMSPHEKEKWLQETAQGGAKSYAGLQLQYAKEGEMVKFKSGNASYTGVAGKNGKVTTSEGYVFENVHKDASGGYVTDYTLAQAQEVYNNRNKKGKLASVPNKNYTSLSSAEVKNLQEGLNSLMADGVINFGNALTVDGDYGPLTMAAVKVLQAKLGFTGRKIDGKWGQNTRNKFHNSDFKAYKTGGLADFTGPAWLDGTKARPEYILNADQTKAFFQLVDVLSSLERTPTNSTQNNGDINLDIDINVETINDTADLDMISSYIEEKIVSSANYRNNNVVGRSR